jgi:hypothetical protein
VTKPELTEDLKQRLTAVLSDLNENGRHDPEAVWHIGSLVDRLVRAAKTRDWETLKSGLTRQGYDSLLESLETQGNVLHQAGNEKAAYAVQAVAMSLIASKSGDTHIAEGNRLMDQFINYALASYRHAAANLN